MREGGDFPPYLTRTGEVLWKTPCTKPKHLRARENKLRPAQAGSGMPACPPILWMGWGGRGPEIHIAKPPKGMVSLEFFISKGVRT